MKLKEMVDVAEEKVMRMMRKIPCPTRAEENQKNRQMEASGPLPITTGA